MTFVAIRKMTSRLTPAQKLKLAEELLAESAPTLPKRPSLSEIQQRGEDILSRKVKPISRRESNERIKRLMSKLRQTHAFRAAQ